MDIKDIQPVKNKMVRRVDWFARVEFIISIIAIVGVLVGLTILYKRQSALFNNPEVLGAQTEAYTSLDQLMTEIDNLNIRIDELNEQIGQLKESPPTSEVVEQEVVSATSSQKETNIESKININTADVTELDSLPGIGPTYAQRIVDYRNANGPFLRIEDVTKVKGIGDKTFTKFKDLITI